MKWHRGLRITEITPQIFKKLKQKLYREKKVKKKHKSMSKGKNESVCVKHIMYEIRMH